MPFFFAKLSKMNKISYNTAYNVQSVTSYYGVAPMTLALKADYVLSALLNTSVSFVTTA